MMDAWQRSVIATLKTYEARIKAIKLIMLWQHTSLEPAIAQYDAIEADDTLIDFETAVAIFDTWYAYYRAELAASFVYNRAYANKMINGK